MALGSLRHLLLLRSEVTIPSLNLPVGELTVVQHFEAMKLLVVTTPIEEAHPEKDAEEAAIVALGTRHDLFHPHIPSPLPN
jgi:hypothetical protein